MKNQATIWKAPYCIDYISEIGLERRCGAIGLIGRDKKRLRSDYIGAVGQRNPNMIYGQYNSVIGYGDGQLFISRIGS